MKKIITPEQSLILLRIGISVIMMAHGFQRLYYGTVGDFGGFLNTVGFPFGTALAWCITIFELTGGFLLALGLFTRWISLLWMIVISSGIILVHAQNGWYVVGPSTGGVEYSFLILICLIVLAVHNPRSSWKLLAGKGF